MSDNQETLEEHQSFSVGFGGENEIELEYLVKSLDGILELIKLLQKEISINSSIDIKVQSSREGSFILDLIMMGVNNLPEVATKENIELLTVCITGMSALIGLKLHLKGKKPKEVIDNNNGTINISNCDNNTITINNYVYNTYTPGINEPMKKIFSNTDRESFYIEKDHEKIISVNKQEFKEMAKPIEETEMNIGDRVETSTIVIVAEIKKPDMMGNSQWDLMYKGKKMRVTITDTKFLLDVHTGKIPIIGITQIKVKVKTSIIYNNKDEEVKTNHYVQEVLSIESTNNREQQIFSDFV